MATEASPVDRIEEWRRKASNFSSTDRIGNLITRALEVLKGLARSEISFDDLEYALESLEMERALALKHNKDKTTDDVRSFMYGVIESIGVAVNTMVTLQRIRTSEEATVEDPQMSRLGSADSQETREKSIPRQFPVEESLKFISRPSSSTANSTVIKEEEEEIQIIPEVINIKQEDQFMYQDDKQDQSTPDTQWDHQWGLYDTPSISSRMMLHFGSHPHPSQIHSQHPSTSTPIIPFPHGPGAFGNSSGNMPISLGMDRHFTPQSTSSNG
ncbi:hypothetical protein PENTCL1PPCAC_8469, partial [Pristionchus entomophagus]